MRCCVSTINERESPDGLHEHRKVYLNVNLHDSILKFKTSLITSVCTGINFMVVQKLANTSLSVCQQCYFKNTFMILY